MILTLILLLLLCLYGIQFGKNNAYKGYISKGRSNAVKGVFILLVFIGHIKNYIVDAGYEYHGTGDTVFQTFFNLIGQLVVVMFLFYSGYGVMESIRKKGNVYVKAMPKHRVLNTLLNFDMAVCFFLVVNLLMGKEVTVQEFLLSLVAWGSLGNSNWYIFAILVCYFATSIIARFAKTEKTLLRGVFLSLTIVAWGLMLVKESWWYNTLWAYSTGMFYSTNKTKVEDLANRKWALVTGILLVLFCAIYVIPFSAAGFKHNALSIVFALLVVVLTMRIKIDNKVLQWCGEKLFPLYIYQRIPMIVFAAVLPAWMLNVQPLVYIGICFLSTLVLTYFYRFIKISL